MLRIYLITSNQIKILMGDVQGNKEKVKSIFYSVLLLRYDSQSLAATFL